MEGPGAVTAVALETPWKPHSGYFWKYFLKGLAKEGRPTFDVGWAISRVGSQ